MSVQLVKIFCAIVSLCNYRRCQFSFDLFFINVKKDKFTEQSIIIVTSSYKLAILSHMLMINSTNNQLWSQTGVLHIDNFIYSYDWYKKLKSMFDNIVTNKSF